jgi:hypothetical protein
MLTTSHAANTAALASIAKESDELNTRETEMREMVVQAEEKRAWFDGFKEWLDSVADFLDQKVPLFFRPCKKNKNKKTHIYWLVSDAGEIGRRTCLITARKAYYDCHETPSG